jgi:RHS repeat-associated protein
LQNTTDYIDGFVYGAAGAGTDTLTYFPMPEGRALKSGSSIKLEYVITDNQGNVRVTFDNSGTGGAAKVKQENSYYPFGLIMPSSLVATPTTPNENLYNGGSEWQNDYNNLPDYYQTFYRNYDAALGRWIGVDPKAESAESMTSYHYGGNNPVMFNDPMGDLLDPDKMSKPVETGHENALGQVGEILPGLSPSSGPSGVASLSAWETMMISADYNSFRDALVGDEGSNVQKAAMEALDMARHASVGPTDLTGINQLTNQIYSIEIKGGAIGTRNDNGTYTVNTVTADLTSPLRGGGYGANFSEHTISLGDPNGPGDIHIGRDGRTLPTANSNIVQYGGMCFYQTMSNVGAYFNRSIPNFVPALAYAKSKLGANATNTQLIEYASQNGVLPADIASILGQYFNGGFIERNVASMRYVIDHNNPIMAFLYEGNGLGHEVMITGYSTSGLEFNYYDPQLGSYRSTIYNNFNSPYEITGVK